MFSWYNNWDKLKWQYAWNSINILQIWILKYKFILDSPDCIDKFKSISEGIDNYSEPLRSQLHYTISWGTIHELVQRLTLD